MKDFKQYMVPGKRGHLIGVGGVSMSPLAEVLRGMGLVISGSDINPEALELARRHIRQAGLEQQMIHLDQIPLQELNLDKKNGIFICNPPYGERLSDQKQCRILYHDLFLLKKRHPSWQLCAISSDPAFERSFGRRADRKRRLYNGRLECVYYMYY